PEARTQLTRKIAATQGVRGEATIERIKLLNGRSPVAVTGADSERLHALDGKIEAASQRLDALKAKRRAVNELHGDRWLDRLEVDVLTGGAIGVPGVFSGSIAGGFSMGDADRNTGMREAGLIAYAMPALSIGGYGKIDLGYSRQNGLALSGGGGADFLGLWGGPGGHSWGNKFAGGFWFPQVLNVGAGYGVHNEKPYGAFILGTFWPPFSNAAARLDIVVRHPSFALSATRGAEAFRRLSESKLVVEGKKFFDKVGGVASDAVSPITTRVTEFSSDVSFDRRVRRASLGLSPSASVAFADGLRTLQQGDTERLGDVKKALEHAALEHPEHGATQSLLAALAMELGEQEPALNHAERALGLAAKAEDPQELHDARDNFVKIALAQRNFDRAWPVLEAWISDPKAPNSGLDAKLHLTRWLAANGRAQEAKQIAEGLAFEHPYSFEAQNMLSDVTKDRPTAEAPT
ncbi:MAG: hypothetical protein AAFY60_08470, partial [Myxococcota bacterium]